MQNLLVSASALPPTVNVAAAVPDTTSVNAPGGQEFSAVLAHTLIAKTIKPKPDDASPDAAASDSLPYQTVSDIAQLQVPSDLGIIAPGMLALSTGISIQPDERGSGHQRSILGKMLSVKPVGGTENTADIAAPGSIPPDEHSSVSQRPIPGKALAAALATQTSAPPNFPQTVPAALATETSAPPSFPQTAAAALATETSAPPSFPQTALPAALATETSAPPSFPQTAFPARPVRETKNTAEIATPGSTPPDEGSPGHQHVIQGKALPATLAAETSAPRNSQQAALPDAPALESGKKAEIAAPGRFLPPVAAEEKIPHSGTDERVTQRLPDGAPLPQMTNSLSPATASLAPASAATTRDLIIDTRVGAPGWSGELAQKVVWMATQQQQTAELHLNPPHLGPVEVLLTIGNDQGTQASIQFASPHLLTREAIETALPQLREMMADNGISLGNVTVSADSFQQNTEAGRQRHTTMKPPADTTETDTGFAPKPTVTIVRGGNNRLVDTFA